MIYFFNMNYLGFIRFGMDLVLKIVTEYKSEFP